MAATQKKTNSELELFQRLVDGDEQACRDFVKRSHDRAGRTVLELCEILAEAFYQIGDAWQCSELSIYREHIASQIASRLITVMRTFASTPSLSAPVAIGCTPSDDPYVLPTSMVEIVLQDAGWRSHSLGTNLPLEELLPAIKHFEPQLCWVSVSHVESEEQLRRHLDTIDKVGRRTNVKMICGGRALIPQLRTEYNVTFMESLVELDQYARAHDN